MVYKGRQKIISKIEVTGWIQEMTTWLRRVRNSAGFPSMCVEVKGRSRHKQYTAGSNDLTLYRARTF